VKPDTKRPRALAVVFETSWGWAGAACSGRGVVALCLPQDTREIAQRTLCSNIRQTGCEPLHVAIEDLERRGNGAVGAVRAPAGLEPGRASSAMALLSEVLSAVLRYFDGETVDLSCFPVDLDWATPFQRGIYREMLRIPRGSVLSYGEVAWAAGSPLAARAAGQAAARNPIPLLVPCHRVVAADGLGGFGRRPEMKRRLLALEGASGFKRRHKN